MAGFVEVTNERTGKKIWINAAHVMYLSPGDREGLTVVTLTDKTAFPVHGQMMDLQGQFTQVLNRAD